jgi:hypothetical protein
MRCPCCSEILWPPTRRNSLDAVGRKTDAELRTGTPWLWNARVRSFRACRAIRQHGVDGFAVSELDPAKPVTEWWGSIKRANLETVLPTKYDALGNIARRTTGTISTA